MKRSSLFDQHATLGAEFGEAGGWEVPLRYGDPLAEHAAARTAVGLADLSHRGKLRVVGDDRITWLQSIISNDILPLKPGRGLYSSLLSHKGKMLTYFRVYMQADSLVLEDVGEIGDLTVQTLKKFLLYGTRAKMENWADSHVLLLVSGPKAAAAIQAAWGLDVSGLHALHFTSTEIAGAAALIIRTEETGEQDFEILLPAQAAPVAWQQLCGAGEPLGLRPIGAQAREMLRIEAGLPAAGKDLTEEIVPPEANLEGKAFSLTKGCYPGQEVVARMDTYGNVRRRLVGLILRTAHIPEHGAKIFSEDREVGWVSSAAYSPIMNAPLALGFPLRDFSAADTALTVEIAGARFPAIVRPLPFYSKA